MCVCVCDREGLRGSEMRERKSEIVRCGWRLGFE